MTHALQIPPGLQILYFGHASFQVTTSSGKVILVDPWLEKNPACPAELKKVEQADLILITHGHGDHLDSNLPEIAKRTGADIVACNEIVDYLEKRGVEDHLENMNKGGTMHLRGQHVTMTHAIHFSSIGLENGTRSHFHEAAGYVLETEERFRIYFAGDTGIFSDMQLIGQLYQPHIAVLPIGDRFTMGPREAALAIKLLGASFVIPCHYGTFPFLTGTPGMLREETKEIEGLTIYEMKPGDRLSAVSLS